MSSTARGSKRVDADFYETPHWVTRRLVEVLSLPPSAFVYEPCVGDGAIIEAAPRDWRWITSDIRGPASERFSALLSAGQLHDYAVVDATSPRSVLAQVHGRNLDAAITNPPFSQAEQIARALLDTTSCPVALLQRINWLGGGRNIARVGQRVAEPIHTNLLGEQPLPQPSTYVLPQRPSFGASRKCDRNKGGCGHVDFVGWRVWARLTVAARRTCPDCSRHGLKVTTSDSIEYAWFVWHRDGEPARIGILPDTPIEERRAA